MRQYLGVARSTLPTRSSWPLQRATARRALAIQWATLSTSSETAQQVHVWQGGRDDSGNRRGWLVSPAGVSAVSSPTSTQSAAGASPAQAKKWLRTAVLSLLPSGYPDTVSPSYLRYACWSGAAAVFGAAGGVLSMQSLLYAVGVGAGAVPLAAALNWVLKDGLGQLGGVAYAALLNNRFDSDPKRWRMVSALALDASTFLEVLTPLVPALFLPVAAVANIGKNIAWLSASATRAGLHQSFARTGNLADVTAKSGSQTIAASTAGTALGIALSPLVGTATGSIVLAFGCVALCHELCVYQSLRASVLPTLSDNRLLLALQHVIRTSDGALTSAAMDAHAVLDPAAVGAQERFLPWHASAERQAAALAGDGPSSSSGSSIRGGVTIVVGPAVTDQDAESTLQQQHGNLVARKYIISARGDGGGGMQLRLWYCSDASWRHVLLGYTHALRARAELAARLSRDARTAGTAPDRHVVAQECIAAAERWLGEDARGEKLLTALEAKGWWVGQPLLERDVTQRLHVEPAASPAAVSMKNR